MVTVLSGGAAGRPVSRAVPPAAERLPATATRVATLAVISWPRPAPPGSVPARSAEAAAASRRHPVEVARGWPAVPGEAFGHRAANLVRAVGGHERDHATAEAAAGHARARGARVDGRRDGLVSLRPGHPELVAERMVRNGQQPAYRGQLLLAAGRSSSAARSTRRFSARTCPQIRRSDGSLSRASSPSSLTSRSDRTPSAEAPSSQARRRSA